MNGFYTIPQIVTATKEYNYRSGELIDENGRKIFGHAASMKPDAWLKKTVQDWARRPETPPGVYYINLFADARKNTQPANFPIWVGKGKPTMAPGNAPVVIHMPKEKNGKTLSEANHPLSWDMALNYQEQISKLQVQVNNLTYENAQLKAENETLKEANTKALGEGKQADFMNNILQVGLPILSEFMESQKQKRLIELAMATGQPLPVTALQPQQPKVNPVAHKFQQQNEAALVLQKADEFIESLSDEEFERIDDLWEQFKATGNPNKLDFLNVTIKDNEPEIHTRLYAYLTGGEQ